jgi:hypothetical protein
MSRPRAERIPGLAERADLALAAIAERARECGHTWLTEPIATVREAVQTIRRLSTTRRKVRK